MTDKREPWSKFYWADWRANKELRLCSLSARGLWMEMLCLMHDGIPYGHLVINGKPPTVQQLALQIGAPLAAVKKGLAEIEAANVADLRDGIWVSRRMERDARRRAVNRANGENGGNPKLMDKPSDNRTETVRITEPVKPPLKSHDARDPDARCQMPEGVATPTPVSVSAKAPDDDLAVPALLDRTTPAARAKALHPKAMAALGSAPNANPDWLAFAALTAMLEAGAGEALILETCKAIGSQAPPGSVASWKYVRVAVENSQARKTADEQADQASTERRAGRIADAVARVQGGAAAILGLGPERDADAVLSPVPGG